MWSATINICHINLVKANSTGLVWSNPNYPKWFKTKTNVFSKPPHATLCAKPSLSSHTPSSSLNSRYKCCSVGCFNRSPCCKPSRLRWTEVQSLSPDHFEQLTCVKCKIYSGRSWFQQHLLITDSEVARGRRLSFYVHTSRGQHFTRNVSLANIPTLSVLTYDTVW